MMKTIQLITLTATLALAACGQRQHPRHPRGQRRTENHRHHRRVPRCRCPPRRAVGRYPCHHRPRRRQRHVRHGRRAQASGEGKHPRHIPRGIYDRDDCSPLEGLRPHWQRGPARLFGSLSRERGNRPKQKNRY